MNITAHLFHSSSAIPSPHMRKVGLHAELFSESALAFKGIPYADAGGFNTDQDLIGRHFRYRQFPHLHLLDPPKFINRYRPHRLM